MRVRPLAAILAVLGAAVAATTIVVTRLPREGWTGASPGAGAPLVTVSTPALEPAATARDGTLEVRVTSGGEPVVGAQVRAYAPGRAKEPGAEPAWLLAGEGRTDARAIAHVLARPGTYLAVARAAGLYGLAEVLRAPGEDVSRADLQIDPPVELRGRVASRGGPVARGLVRATPVASRWPTFAPPSAPGEEIRSASTSEDGAFRLEGLAPGSYALSVEARGYHPALLQHVEAPAEPIAVPLEPLGTIHGVAVLEDGRPASGATVRAASLEHRASAKAGPDGRFTLAAAAGCYRIEAVLGDRAAATRGPVSLGPGAAASPVELRLGPAASVQGEVVLAAGRAPAAGAEVALVAHDTHEVSARARSGADGRFSIGGLAPGAYDLRAFAPGTSAVLVPGITLATGSRFSLRVVLPGTGAIEGVVRDPDGRPLAGIGVRVVSRGDGLPGVAPLFTRSGFNGAFRFGEVEVGRAEVVVRADGVLAGSSRAVRVTEGRPVRADVVLAEAGFLAGRVSREDGRRPPLGTRVVAVAMRAGLGTLQVAHAAADASGNYLLALPAGEYRVHAAPGDTDRTDLRVAPSFARIEPRQTTRLELALTAPAPEEGTAVQVLEPGGAPSPGAAVTISRSREGRVALATAAGDDGRVVLPPDMGMTGRAVTIRARNGGRSGEATLELPRAGTVPVTLSPGGSVQGVVRARSGRPAGFTLEVASQPSPGAWRMVDVHRFDGDRFEIADVPAEHLRLTVRTDDGRRGEAEVRVAGGETRAVTIALDPTESSVVRPQ